MSVPSRRDPFAFESLNGGGVLLDLTTGQILALNRTAAFVWERYLAGENVDRIAAAFAQAFAVDGDTADADVASALRSTGSGRAPRAHAVATPPGAPTYRRSPDGYQLVLGESTLLEVSTAGGAVRVVTPLPPRELGAYLRVLSPKLAALRGMFVLHASAVRRPLGDVVAFSGASGSGKTTTAHAFAQAGCELLCEDKLIIRFEGNSVMALRHGERDMASFMDALQSRLGTLRAGEWLDLDHSFDDIVGGPADVLTKILLLDAGRRSGASIVLESPPLPQASARLFENVFVGSEDSDEWRLGLTCVARVARQVHIHVATMPEGVGALHDEAKRYTAMTAS